MKMIGVTEKPIDIEKILGSVGDDAAGGNVHFIGTVRREDGIEGINYEAYSSMAVKMMSQIADDATRQWCLKKVAAVHRIGFVPIGEAAVVIAVSAPHRKEAFEACRFLIDRIKEKAPIWKIHGSERK